MNRRTFLKSGVAATLLASSWRFASAQAAEGRWDEASFLFGNAWDLLPQAEDGKTELLSVTAVEGGSMFGFRQIVGLIHNNTDDERALASLEVEGMTDQVFFSTYQEKIAPHSYSLMAASIMSESEGELPAISASFASYDEAVATNGYEIKNIPLQIDASALNDDGVTSTLVNTSDTDIPDSILSGLIIFFDANGNVVSGTALGELAPLAAGESVETQNFIFSEFDPAAPFLIGYYGLPD